MSTNDVPGAVASNNDELALGCWAEHEDGSLIFVMSTEGGRVIYSMFDLSKQPVVEYRDAMPEADFKKQFSWKSSKRVKWIWHDKTPFDWNRIIKAGATDGARFASAADLRSAAERVADSLHLRASEFDAGRFSHLTEVTTNRLGAIRDKIKRALTELMN